MADLPVAASSQVPDDIAKQRVTTLAVVPTNRGPGIAWDTVNALLWGATQPMHVIVMDTLGDVAASIEQPVPNVTVLATEPIADKRLSGFKTNEGISYALEYGPEFDQVLVIDDDSLIIRPGLDSWAQSVLSLGSTGLLGVADRVDYQAQWFDGYAFFKSLLPARWQVTGRAPATTLFYAIVFMSRKLVDKMADTSLLVPAGFERWSSWPDVYLSWSAHLLEEAITDWGHMDRQRPPIYADHPAHQTLGGIDPFILSSEFKAFHSVRAVRGYSELAIRKHYFRCRRDTGWEPVGPVSFESIL